MNPHNTKWAPTHLLAVAWLILSGTIAPARAVAAGTPPDIRAVWQESEDGFEIQLKYYDSSADPEHWARPSDEKPAGFILGDTTEDPASYELVTSDDKAPVPITWTVATGERGEAANDHLAAMILLELVGDPDCGKTFILRVNGIKVQHPVDGVLTFSGEIELDSERLQINCKWRTAPPLQPKLELAAGEGTGMFLGKFDWRIGDDALPPLLSGFFLGIGGSADLTLDSDDKSEFYDNLTGDVRLSRPTRTTFGGLTSLPRYTEIGIQGSVESDQEADNADGLVGAHFVMYTDDPLSAWLSRQVIRDPDRGVISPFLALQYDYAEGITDDAETVSDDGGTDDSGGAVKPDTDGGSHRFEAGIYWALPVWKGFEPTWFPGLSGPLDVDVLLEAVGIYDTESSELYDQSKISLEISPAGRGINPALTLTWARGESPPIFDDVNAFLAGIRVLLDDPGQ